MSQNKMCDCKIVINENHDEDIYHGYIKPPLRECEHIYTNGERCNAKCTKNLCGHHVQRKKYRKHPPCQHSGCNRPTLGRFCHYHTPEAIERSRIYSIKYYSMKKNEKNLDTFTVENVSTSIQEIESI